MSYNTSRWFSGGLIFRGTRVLVIWYEHLGKRSLQFPGGSEKSKASGNGRDDQNPKETLKCELGEEILESGSVTSATPFWKDVVSPTHTRHWFIVKIDGELRMKDKIDSEEGMPDEILSPPFFMDVESLFRDLNLKCSHKLALGKSVLHMSKISQDFGWIAHSLGLA